MAKTEPRTALTREGDRDALDMLKCDVSKKLQNIAQQDNAADVLQPSLIFVLDSEFVDK